LTTFLYRAEYHFSLIASPRCSHPGAAQVFPYIGSRSVVQPFTISFVFGFNPPMHLPKENSHMNTIFFSVVASTYLLASPTLTYASCSTAFTEKLASTERIVDSLRPDKPGQTRVFASDGSEFTAGQALWMKGQLRSVLQACVQGDEVSADSRLHGVIDLLNAHHRAL